MAARCHYRGLGWMYLKSHMQEALYSDFQYSIDNGHMGTPSEQTRLKTLPSHNFIGGQ